MIEWKRLPSNADLMKFADYLEDVHEYHQPERRMVNDRCFLGGLGQRKLAYLTGGEIDMRRLRGRGDGGVDQMLEFKDGSKWGADVKIARNPKELIVAVKDMAKKTQKMMFILGKLVNEHLDPLYWDAELLVWDWDTELLKREPKYHTKERIILNHWKPAKQCRDIHELLAKIERRWGRGA